ncbi:MAG: glycerol-3-phosphate 1-O-acyltransferase PlsY [Dehalococcoidales bacterium]|jgi:glycerol-3-phosphate acyltransferase PlsY
MTAFMYISVVVIGYLLGAIPFGLIIGKVFANKDVREVGSGKIGMTNVLRTAGKKAAVLSLLLDIGKGALAVFIAGLIFHGKTQEEITIFTWIGSAKALGALAAIAGHSWSVFLGFKGGRGVATFMGGLAAMYWPAALVGGILIFGIGFRTKYMSLGSIIGAISAFILLMSLNIAEVKFFGYKNYPPFEYVVFAMIGALFVYFMHRDNIIRLYNGTERMIGEKSKAGTPAHNNNPK